MAMPQETIDQAFRTLDALDLGSIESRGDWGLGRMFSHLAQGVDFSMTGYPVHKPRLFQATAGKLAFAIFSARGRMSHGLNEEIPGEIVEPEISSHDGMSRLVTSLETFRDFNGAMRPHFAYGALSKEKFAQAHLLHIKNHLTEVSGHQA